jgi:hypothetical protein
MAIMAPQQLNNFGTYHHTLFDVDKNIPVPCLVEMEINSQAQYGAVGVNNHRPAIRRDELTLTVTINADIVPDATWAMEWITDTFNGAGSMFSNKYKRSLFVANDNSYNSGLSIYGAYVKTYSNVCDFNNTIKLEIGCDHFTDSLPMDGYFKSIRRDAQLNQLFDNL